MNYAFRHPKGKVLPGRSRPVVRPWRWASRAARSVGRFFRRTWCRSVARGQVAPARWWWPKLSWAGFIQHLSWLAAGLTGLWVGSAVYELVSRAESPIEKWCKSGGGNGCVVTYGFLSPFLSLGLATLAFMFVQYFSVRRILRKRATKDARHLVPTAGPIAKEVVGRREMCLIISRALRDRRTRRPYVLVGGVGAGKTSVLVQLTHMLAKKGAFPVPIRMRDVDVAGDRLDFREMAMKRFCEIVDRGAISGRQSERVWRQLCMEDKAVVIADGLEETFTEDGDEKEQKERDILIRQAIRQAERQKLPLVIASRPHPPLEQTRAAIIDLEPLSEEAALEYLEESREDRDSGRMDWIVKTAAVSESPLYLQIASELQEHRLLDRLDGPDREGALDTRKADRPTLQLRLLDTWRQGLITGRILGELPLPSARRKATVEVMSALAGIGLLQDRLEVCFDALIGAARPFPGIWRRLRERLPECPDHTDSHRCRSLLALCATEGEQLGLVEARGDSVRFPHSILQAYLGSGYVGVSRHKPLAEALKEPGPGRELLMALVLHSRRALADGHEAVTRLLLKAAGPRTDAKTLGMYAAALDIDRAIGAPRHQDIAQALCHRWPDIKSGDRRTLLGAKLILVQQFGEALRAIGAAAPGDPAHGRTPAYASFFDIAEHEPSHSVRLALAREFGAGGDKAFDALRAMFPLPRTGAAEERDPWVQYEQERLRQLHTEHRAREKLLRRPRSNETHEQYLQQKAESDACRLRIWRRFVMRAWLVPMMVGSVTHKHRSQAMERLRLWLVHLEPEHSRSREADLPLSLEMALAQGFKCAANRRARHPCTNKESRDYLVGQAESMLAHARYWYSQLTLIHALCLWELPDDPAHRAKRTDPAQAVARWLALAGSKQDQRSLHPDDRTPKGIRLHPFVAEGAALAVLALESGHPERFLWIDETEAMVNVGSSPEDPGAYRKQNLWIPPSSGWTTLHPRAQQLLGDVLLLLHLVQRDGKPDELEERLTRANRAVLPPCLHENRTPLHPRRSVGMAKDAPPGSMCLRHCPFELCPYPALGSQPHAELREAFCRQQQALLRAYPRRGFKLLSWLSRKRAPWQGMTRSELDQFWEEMAKRSRTPSG
ncbi:NACHT domain-containing protein [Streptomyces sp. NPDC001404]|uniref:NACHT domain-containing protein n=1 Tax=Streptomyces sp. NPDC001404 TaxID=3364571 RepID=UPI003692726D